MDNKNKENTLKLQFKAMGHKNVKSTHKSTLELTKEDYLTPTGDCIVGINSTVAINDLQKEFKEQLKQGKSLKITLKCKDKETNEIYEDTIISKGSKDLILNHNTDMVIRKSTYICPRTLSINANKSAKDLNRDLIDCLKKENDLLIEFEILEV
ncbi:DUF371 domain-containing protein [Methanococcus voltae]|uniref:DUF371 domain-containing protein n=1 Tax=Methanococcus voltae (strain ATCC BAA-1334 / A3) TaxID=456320 RepID=D7DTY5_METV3|nr:DUF371 domain-containing protein [Methanococcus voltae]MCS3900395.1 hypothetical protein [Methanococcus voltae]